MKAKDKEVLKGRRPELTYSIIDWPAFCLAIRGKDKSLILDEADEILKAWKDFSYPSAGIINKTSENHQTLTSIVTKKEDTYTIYLIPRNNRTTDELPGGVFHVRPELQILKNEGIGLIEAMGLFILPARLKRQLKLVENIMNNPSIREKVYEEFDELKAFDHIINDMVNRKYSSIENLLMKTGDSILHDINVFKDKEHGEEAMRAFLKELSL
mgnify:FL=1